LDFKYHNYDKLTKFLRTTSSKFPNLTALYSIGKSVQGKNIVRYVSKYLIRFSAGISPTIPADLTKTLTHFTVQLTVNQLIKKRPAFMEAEYFSSRSYELAIRPST
jgi:hypothetical protein